MRVCLTRACPNLTRKTYCPIHQPTTLSKGYGAAHRAERAASLPGATCAWCGKSAEQAQAEGRPLQRDHILPRSLGGSDDPTNKRWGCPSCHNRHGVQSNKNLG